MLGQVRTGLFKSVKFGPCFARLGHCCPCYDRLGNVSTIYEKLGNLGLVMRG
jgi:hypothetical protein